MTYPVTQTAQKVMNNLSKVTTPLNAGLVFDRFTPQKEITEKGYNRNILNKILGFFTKSDSELHTAWIKRWKAMISAQNGQILPMRLQWRFLTGVGMNTPLEVGFAFHRYGFPYLLGSGVKGITRQRYLIKLASDLKISELDQLDQIMYANEGDDLRKAMLDKFQKELKDGEYAKCSNFQYLFGTMNRAGKVIFFDAIPGGNVKLEIDVMTPHFSKHYQKKGPPHDGDNPNPINFLTVAPNTLFYFGVGWRGELKQSEERSFANIKGILRLALKELGAGAKTNAGYGFFYEPEEN